MSELASELGQVLWDALSPEGHALVEARFEERLHPRGRRGQWIDKPVAMGLAKVLADHIARVGPYAYHETDPDNTAAILRRGLRTNSQGVAPAALGSVGIGGPRPNFSYLSVPTKPGHDRFFDYEYPIRVDLRKIDPALLSADEDHGLDLHPHLYKEKHETWGELADRHPDLMSDPKTVSYSLAHGSVAVLGGVPASAVEINPGFDAKGDPGGSDIRWAADHEAIYSGFEHDGLKVEIMSTVQTNHPDATTESIITLSEIEGVIVDGDKAVGVFEHRVQVNNHGELSVYRDAQSLDSEYQGRGFFSAFNKHAEEKYREHGVAQIRLGTIQVGGYAWARAGFVFDTNFYGLFAGMAFGADLHTTYEFAGAYAAMRLFGDRITEPPFRRVGGEAETTMRDLVPPDVWAEFFRRFPTRDQLQAYADGDKAALDGLFQSPSEIAIFGVEHAWTQKDGKYAGQRMWLGKRFMLDSTWNGVKWLRPKS